MYTGSVEQELLFLEHLNIFKKEFFSGFDEPFNFHMCWINLFIIYYNLGDYRLFVM